MRALAVLPLLVASLSACNGDPAYDQSLAPYGFEKVHEATLPGGDRIAVGSRTGHDVTVQWGDGDGWTTPAVVARRSSLWTHDLTVKERDGTVAISADFWEEKELDDDYAPHSSAIVVCRNRACAEAPAPKRLATAQVADDGTLVTYGLDAHRVGFWEDGAFRSAAIAGLPASFAVRAVPDGTFLAVGARAAAGLCHYDLYAAPRGSVAFSLTARGPGFPDPKPCTPYSPDLDLDDADRVSVYVDSAVDQLVFVRTDDGWAAQVPEVEPIAYRDTDGRRTIEPLRLGSGELEVLVGSPDLQQIVAQTRVAGTRTWSAPRTVARAPRDHQCRWAAGEASESGSAMAIVYCYPRSFAWDPREDNSRAPVGLVLATDDGEAWQTRTLARPRPSVGRGDDNLLAQGARRSHVWRAGRLQTIALPTDPLWDQLTLVDDGRRVLRLAGNADPRAVCRPTVTVADVEARAWPAATAVPARIQRDLGRGTCSFEAWWLGEQLEGGVHGMDFGVDLVVRPDGAGGFEVR